LSRCRLASHPGQMLAGRSYPRTDPNNHRSRLACHTTSENRRRLESIFIDKWSVRDIFLTYSHLLRKPTPSGHTRVVRSRK
jgi:hypothetical protein